MYYLLTKSVVDVTDEEITITNQINHRQVDGFMEELLATNVGDNLVSYISYSPEINAESVEQINTWLRRRNYPVLVFKDSRDLREGEVEFVATIEKAIYRNEQDAILVAMDRARRFNDYLEPEDDNFVE